MAGTVRQQTSNGRGAPPGARRHTKLATAQSYGLFVPRGRTAGGPHGVYPGTGHISRVVGGASIHPAVNLPAPVQRGPAIPTPSTPVRRGPIPPSKGRGPGRAPVPKGVGGSVTEVGGFVQQTNAGGTTSGVGGGAFGARAPTGTTLGQLEIPSDFLGLSWEHAAELAALAVGGLLLYRVAAGGRRGRR
jgi:hypothetical protein